MNARELLDLYRKNGPHVTFTTHGAREVVESALSLLAAAEANDGKTPETDAEVFDRNATTSHLPEHLVVDAEISRGIERRCNGLAAEVGRLTKDAERYRFLKSNETRRWWVLYSFSESIKADPNPTEEELDAAIDAERAK